MKNRSIGQRLQRAKSAEVKRKVVDNWIAEWQTEYEQHVRNFERAIRTNDYDLLARTTGWLKADGKKRFDALPRVITALVIAEKEDEE